MAERITQGGGGGESYNVRREALPMRTLTLTERRPAECRLTGDDLDFLLAEHASHLRLAPTRRRGVCVVTPTRLVGVIAAPNCCLVIRPKLPLRCLFHLLDPDAGLELSRAGPASEGAEALTFLALRLAQLVGERAAAGLHRSYAERDAATPFLQGRLDVAAQLREGPSRRDQFHCRTDELTADVPCNQVPRATLELLLRCPLVGGAAGAALRAALPVFDAVSPAELTPEAFGRAAADRGAASYGPLLDLCRLLADGLRPGLADARHGPTFLLDLERVFERYVTRGVREAFATDPQRTVAEQARYPISRPADLVLCPDVTVWEGDEVRTIVDAKWKRRPEGPPRAVAADLHQALSYCAALGAPRAVLVYPGRRDRVATYRLTRSAVRIEVRTLRITTCAAGCRRSLRRLGDAMRRGRD